MEKGKMFKNEADLKKIVSQLNIDSEPQTEHKENLRRQMLSVFKEAAEQPSTWLIGFRTVRRTIMKSPIPKLAAAAAVIIAVVIAIHYFTAPKLVALDIELPKPMFVGTPQPTDVPNLEPPLGKDRPAFYAPEGTKNVAFGKPVTSSDEEPIVGEIEMITDGDKEAADGSYVELGPFRQHVTIDLGNEYEIYAIVLWHYHKQACVYFDVVVQVSNDPDFITDVTTLFNNDIDNSSGLGIGSDMHYVETNEGKLINARGVQARYVRLYSNGNNTNDFNHYIEVEVYGRPR
jgi:hypothetical protein